VYICTITGADATVQGEKGEEGGLKGGKIGKREQL